MIGVIKRLSANLPHDALLGIYQSVNGDLPICNTEALFMTDQIMSYLKAKLKMFSLKVAL